MSSIESIGYTTLHSGRVIAFSCLTAALVVITAIGGMALYANVHNYTFPKCAWLNRVGTDRSLDWVVAGSVLTLGGGEIFLAYQPPQAQRILDHFASHERYKEVPLQARARIHYDFNEVDVPKKGHFSWVTVSCCALVALTVLAGFLLVANMHDVSHFEWLKEVGVVRAQDVAVVSALATLSVLGLFFVRSKRRPSVPIMLLDKCKKAVRDEEQITHRFEDHKLAREVCRQLQMDTTLPYNFELLIHINPEE